MAIGPIITLLMSHFLTKNEKFTFIKFISIFVGFIGVIFIFNISSFDSLLDYNFLDIFAKILVILAAFDICFLIL